MALSAETWLPDINVNHFPCTPSALSLVSGSMAAADAYILISSACKIKENKVIMFALSEPAVFKTTLSQSTVAFL